MLQYNKQLKSNSRELRKNMTDAERLLWSKIRNKQLKGYRFARQKIIGDYIVDFFCSQALLVIELDGGQHYTTEGIQKDRIRDRFISNPGIRVLKFSDRDILTNISGVIDVILGYLYNQNPPSPL